MPKPVLSDSSFNADDVATAILQNANLQVANSNLGVTDVSSSYSISGSGHVMFTNEPIVAFKFNGFVFMQWSLVWPSAVADGDNIISINDPSLYPSHPVKAPAISYEGDTVSAIRASANATHFTFIGERNLGNTGLHLSANYFYRIA